MVVLIPSATVAAGLGALSARAAQDEPLLWYLTRTFAVASYIALTLSVLLGMLRAIARTSGERLSWVVDELHSFAASLTGGLIAGHLISLKFDPFIPFTFANLFIPGDQPYRPLASNLGVFAFYTMAVVLVTSWIRALLPYRFWRVLHVFSFVAFGLVTAHGLLAGSDASEPWQRALYGMAVGAVGFLTLLRLVGGKKKAALAEEA
jgi:methionine sulfoxide reductase heme-binding subunit